ncbi:MAG: helix-turn-helix domain-containing protein [Thaumarchaeota archaeon]|nr:helix-turn-helix domain-containing protein [Nitrososphaerota archaeon]
MRRLVVELPVAQFKIASLEKTFENLKSYTILHRLNWDQNGYVAISRIELKNPDYDLENFVRPFGVTEIRSIYRESKSVHIALVTGRPAGLPDALSFPNVYILGPFEIRDGKLKISFIGMSSPISKFLKKMERAKIRYRVLSLSDAKFSQESPLSKLTEKQRTVLLAAYNMGYYDIPRRVDSEQLGKKLNLVSSTVAEHLRKAERRLIEEVISH